MLAVPTPVRRERAEILDGEGLDPELVRRSMGDVARANALFGGASALLAELEPALRDIPRRAILLDVGTGLGDIPARAARLARRHGIDLWTVGVDAARALAQESGKRIDAPVCADALRLPFRDGAVDIVTCSQILHHFSGERACALLREANRVARERVVVSDIRRSWAAAAGLWLASFPLLFHPVSRHDGVVSVLKGFTASELRQQVRDAIGIEPRVHTRSGFRVTTSWRPA